ncbi:integrase-like protein [Collimonas sp. PA-H2]|uniref:integrase catalytic domain-containing protein n=1 Tax=Collimonas sp. PA-H2 TaxID=1881062 RepID=UPI000C001F9A|nr:DDE-type integrase/transposase/recombinase [Collimonas sp. PA-H2]PFH10105.1 integrase-like protein [Collimonas sp. PA-H2]
MTFTPSPAQEKVQIGLVIRMGLEAASEMVRITHIFPKCIYVIPVSTPDMARYAKRPYEMSLGKLLRWLKTSEWQIGRLRLPPEFLLSSEECDGAYEAIKPLVEIFEDERALGRSMFTVHIQRRAVELDISPVSLRRMLLRFYYFGRLKAALQPLKVGRPIEWEGVNTDSTISRGITSRRRGRQPVEAEILGRNEFSVTRDDIDDMVSCYEDLAKKGKVKKTVAHSEYLAQHFSKRNPDLYKKYLDKQCPLPVTIKQFRDYTGQYASFTAEMAENAGQSHRQQKGATLAVGPGEYYEIDATGGRIHLVDSENPDVVLGTPVIYLILDRWSRFIVSIYVTLRPASWEEIRIALLIAFTPRNRRFRNLGINVDEDRWPQGRICSHMVQDRGSEMISRAMLEAAVDGLHIEPETLPPLCPDGKGIIERTIRKLKDRMADRRLKGGFQDRPLDPKSRRKFRVAKGAAAYSLRELYWTLIDIVDEHNNSSHRHLEAKTILRRTQVRPTPRDAYLWGLENITGLECPPLEDADYLRLLMGNDKATIANGAVMFRNRKYYPANAAAERQARHSTSSRSAIDIKVDRSYPVEIFVPMGGQDWPQWKVNKAGLQELQEITLEEEDQLHDKHRLLIAKTRNDSFVDGQLRLARDRGGKGSRVVESTTATEHKKVRREAESERVKDAILGRPTKVAVGMPTVGRASRVDARSQGEELEERERRETIERMRRRK